MVPPPAGFIQQDGSEKQSKLGAGPMSGRRVSQAVGVIEGVLQEEESFVKTGGGQERKMNFFLVCIKSMTELKSILKFKNVIIGCKHLIGTMSCPSLDHDAFMLVEVIQNGEDVNNTYSLGAVAKISCTPGYGVNLNNETVTCEKGRWRPKLPQCSARESPRST